MKQIRHTLRIVLLTILGSSIMGLLSAGFLTALNFVTVTRDEHVYLILFLPIVGLLTAWAYKHYGKGSDQGINLIIKSVHQEEKVPLRMSVFAAFFTLATHLTGGSVGMEGTVVQIGGSIFNRFANTFKLSHKEKRILVMAGISAAFGSAFGTPLAGAFFGLEMTFIGKLSYEAILPCFIAAYTANYVTSLFGISHGHYAITGAFGFNLETIGIVIVSALVFGLVGRLFSLSVKKIREFYKSKVRNYLIRILIGCLVVVALVLIFDMGKYSGLSNWMRVEAFAGTSSIFDTIRKFILTVLSLGAGLIGGEVTPLFNIGATTGSFIGQLSGIEVSLMAALGMIAVFGSATNTPLTTIMLGIEIFGTKAIPYYIIVAIIGYYVIGHNGIYGEQLVEVEKLGMSSGIHRKSLREYGNERRL